METRGPPDSEDLVRDVVDARWREAGESPFDSVRANRNRARHHSSPGYKTPVGNERAEWALDPAPITRPESPVRGSGVSAAGPADFLQDSAVSGASLVRFLFGKGRRDSSK